MATHRLSKKRKATFAMAPCFINGTTKSSSPEDQDSTAAAALIFVAPRNAPPPSSSSPPKLMGSTGGASSFTGYANDEKQKQKRVRARSPIVTTAAPPIIGDEGTTRAIEAAEVGHCHRVLLGGETATATSHRSSPSLAEEAQLSSGGIVAAAGTEATRRTADTTSTTFGRCTGSSMAMALAAAAAGAVRDSAHLASAETAGRSLGRRTAESQSHGHPPAAAAAAATGISDVGGAARSNGGFRGSARNEEAESNPRRRQDEQTASPQPPPPPPPRRSTSSWWRARVQSASNAMETSLLSFLRAFLDDGHWWSTVGLILLSTQVYVIVSLLLPPSSTSVVFLPSLSGYWTVFFVERGCALANAVAFASYYVQLPGLIGSKGLSPAKDVVRKALRQSRRHHNIPAANDQNENDEPQRRRRFGGVLMAKWCRRWKGWFTEDFLRFPTVFWFVGSDDHILRAVCGGGCVLSTLLFAVPFFVSAAGGSRDCQGGVGWDVLGRESVLPELIEPLVTALSAMAWWACGFLYLSLIHVSGDFLGLQSDSNLVEIDALLGVLALIRIHRPGPALVVLRFFAFRKMLGCGICKWYGSQMWQAGTAMTVHYYTQPLPNRWSCYAHRMPAGFHRFSVWMTFVIEMLLPYLIWIPVLPMLPPWLDGGGGESVFTSVWWRLQVASSIPRYMAWVGFNMLNLAINTTGNYGFIGFLNTMENLSLADDGVWRWLLGRLPAWRFHIEGGGCTTTRTDPGTMNGIVDTFTVNTRSIILFFMRATGFFLRMAVAAILVTYLAVSSLRTLSRASKGRFDMNDLLESSLVRALPRRLQKRVQHLPPWIQWLYHRLHTLRLTNYQGKFGSMHEFRWEPILEGSRDGVTWHEYKWRYKLNIGEAECGRVLPLHLPRLDWRVWFLPLYARRGAPPPLWYRRLLRKLLDRQPEVVALLQEDPFRDGRPPRFVRSRLEDFTIAQSGSGRWWDSRPLVRRHDTPLDFVLGQTDEDTKKDE